MTKDIIGGVSPLKAKRQASRGGKHAGKATATAKRRGGFAKSRGARGAGGRNVGGYNVQTRFKADKWVKPPSGGISGVIPMEKPYSYDPEGNLQLTEYKQDPDTKTPKRESKGTFDEVWDANEDNFQDKWDSKEEWVEQAQKEIDEGYYTETKTVKGKKWSRTYQVNKDGKRIPNSESEWRLVGEATDNK